MKPKVITMSDILKCPFCNKKLEPIGTSGQFQCGTWGCDASFNFIATRDVWEYIERTRKALDVAKDAIDVISLKYHKDTPSIFLIKYAQNAKAEITALEQKD